MPIDLKDFIKLEKIPSENTLEDFDPTMGDDDSGITINDLSGLTTIPDYLLYDPEVVGYPDKEMQEELYAWTLQEICPLTGAFNILDIGAGRGDLQKYIQEKYPNVALEYNGIEAHSGLVKSAEVLGNNVRYGNFHTDEFLYGEWAVCIGSLNEESDSTGGKWEIFEKMVSKVLILNENKGLVFILLTEDADYVSYPINEMVMFLDENYPDIPFKIDRSKFAKVYKLTIFNDKFPD